MKLHTYAMYQYTVHTRINRLERHKGMGREVGATALASFSTPAWTAKAAGSSSIAADGLLAH